MANRRMFSMQIVDSDAFTEMPLSAQALYFQMGMRADDDGFINNPKQIQRCVGASDDDLKLLLAKRFILPFDSGVVVIKHWKMNNTIRKDRYTPTLYRDELSLLTVKENGSYTEKPVFGCQSDNQVVDMVAGGCHGCQDDNQVVDKRLPWLPQYRLGKDRLDNTCYPVNQLTGLENKNISTREADDAMYLLLFVSQYAGRQYTARFDQDKVAELLEWHTLDEVELVVKHKVMSWYGTTMQRFIRPSTLFGDKFDEYLEEAEVWKEQGGLDEFRRWDKALKRVGGGI